MSIIVLHSVPCGGRPHRQESKKPTGFGHVHMRQTSTKRRGKLFFLAHLCPHCTCPEDLREREKTQGDDGLNACVTLNSYVEILTFKVSLEDFKDDIRKLGEVSKS